MKHFFKSTLFQKYSPLKHNLLIFMLLLLCSNDLLSQITIKGVVTDERSQPLAGVNVIIKGKQIGVITDIEGNYSLEALPTDIIQYSSLGYKTEEITISDQIVINVKMTAEFKRTDEIINIGYGNTKKRNISGSIFSYKPKESSKIATSNIFQDIEGKVAGVSITQNSGEPGTGMKVRVRGISSVNNSDPLYIVDGFTVNSTDFISPSDIQSIEILKDASSTAIYGMKGANGVFLITTKKGKTEKTTIKFKASAGILKSNKEIDVLNAKEYAKAKLLAYANDSAIRKWRNPEKNIRNFINNDFRNTLNNVLNSDYKGTDWQKEVFRNGIYKNYVLDFSGGTEKLKYNVAGTYFREDGIVINSWFEKYLFRFNSQAEIFKFLNTDLNISYQNTEKTNYDQSSNNKGILGPALYADPISQVYLSDKEQGEKKWGPVNLSQTINPVASAERMKNNKTYTDQILFNFGGEVKITNGLTINSRYGTIITFNRPRRYIPSYFIGINDTNQISSLDESHTRAVTWDNSNYVNFNKDLGKLNIDLTLGQEWQYSDSHTTRIITEGVPDDANLNYATAGTGTIKVNPAISPDFWYDWQTSLLSYFGRCNLNYNDRFTLAGTIRRDASSKIVKQYRWGTFYSLSAKWNIINENFIRDMAILSELSARCGWGVTGNEKSLSNMYSDYSTLSNLLYMVGDNDKVLEGEIPVKSENPKLHWETVKMWNFAIDFGFFKDKVTGTAEYYKKNTTGMIVTVKPPMFTGSRTEDATEANLGNVENNGLEFTLDHKNNIGNFKYEIGGNITLPSKPIVTKLAGEDQPILSGVAHKIDDVIKTSEGEEMAYYYGYKTKGLISEADLEIKGPYLNNVYQKTDPLWFPGQLKLVDLNGDGKINEEDKTNLGSYNPDVTYGFGLNISFKSVDLNVFCYGVQGNEIVNTLNTSLKVPDMGNLNLSKEVLNSWTPEHTNTNVPRLVQSNQIAQNYFNDYFVEDASFLRVQNIEFGYTIPEKISKKAGISNFRLFISGENLFTITNYSGYDPEVGTFQINTGNNTTDPLTQGLDDANYSIAKKYIVGLSITF